MNKTLSETLSDPNVIAIMNSVASRYSRNIDFDQLESIKLNTVWECLKKYDPTRGAKFTSFLYQMLNFSFKNELKKKKREFATDSVRNNTPDHYYDQGVDTFDGIPVKASRILKQKYVYNMTMVEIGKENGYSRETARRKLAEAIKIYKNKNQIEI